MRGVGVIDRDDGVAVAPDRHGRHVGSDLQSVQRADGLAAIVDHGAKCAQECVTGGGVAEGAVGAPDLGAARRLNAELSEPGSHPLTGGQHRRRRDDRHDQLGAGRRQQPQRPPHVRPQPAAADQDQPFAVVGMLVDELHGHPTTERMAHHGRPRDAEFVEQVAQRHRERAQRVVTSRFGRGAVAQQIRGDHPVRARQRPDHRPPGLRTAGHAVQQQDDVAVALVQIGHPVTVQFDIFQVTHGNALQSFGEQLFTNRSRPANRHRSRTAAEAPGGPACRFPGGVVRPRGGVPAGPRSNRVNAPGTP